jgi:hypothetical protein
MNTGAAIMGTASLAAVGAGHKEYQYHCEVAPSVKENLKASKEVLKKARDDLEKSVVLRAEDLKASHEEALASLPKEGFFVSSPSSERVRRVNEAYRVKAKKNEILENKLTEYLDGKEKGIPKENKALDDAHWTSSADTYLPLKAEEIRSNYSQIVTLAQEGL